MNNKLARQIDDLLAELAPDSVFSSPEGQAFVTLPTTQQTFPLHDPLVRDWLTDRYTHLHDTPPDKTVLREALNALRARAYCRSKRRKVALRVAQAASPKRIYIDLSNEKGEAVEITEQGWQVTRFTPGITFRSTRGQLPVPPPDSALPAPALPDSLTPFLPWLLAALQPQGPYPILILHGPPGSGKTTTARMLRALIDPVTTPLCALPGRDRAIEKLAHRHRVLAFDHVTRMSHSASDALCRIASGTGIELREWGDRREPLMLETARPIILTTPRQCLADWQPRPDLASRAIAVHLPAIENPRPQDEIEAEFERLRPQILATLYTALSQSLSSPHPPATATPHAVRSTLYESSASADPLYQAALSFTARRGSWTGTATDLLNEICVSLTPRALSHRLHLLTPALAGRGIKIEHHRKHAGVRQLTLQQTPNFSTPDSSTPDFSALSPDTIEVRSSHSRMFDNLSEKLQRVFKNLRGEGKLTAENMEAALREIRVALLEADVHFRVVKQFIENIKQKAMGEDVLTALSPTQQVVKIVKDELVHILGTHQSKLRFSNEPPSAFLIVGLQGSGKTTSTGKIAKWLSQNGHSPLMVSVDVYRPAARQQLSVISRNIHLPIYEGTPEETRPDELARSARREAVQTGRDVLLVDTAGRLHIDEELMSELRQLKELLNPSEILFVADAMTGQDAVKSADEFHKQLGITGVILTKMDGDARGGAALSIRTITNQPLKFVGVGEKFDALEPFHPDRAAQRILGMGDMLSLIEKVQQNIDEKQAEETQRKLLEDEFTLEDFRDQLRQIRKLGPLESLLGMMPQLGPLKDLKNVKVDENEVTRVVAIIDSMTQKERANHMIINGARRRRIAKGSGTSVQEVNALLKQYAQARKMMKSITGGGFMGKRLGKMKLPPGLFPGM